MEIIKIVQGGIELDVIGSVDASSITQNANNRFVTDAEKTAWNNKVDKVSGKQLSTNDYTTVEKNKLNGIEAGAQKNNVTSTDIANWNNKVDKVSGKQLSTNDYTTAEKNKLSGIQAGAQVNAVTSVNGQTGAVTTPNTTYDAATTTTNGLMSSADKTKLNGIETGAQKNIMSSADKTKLDGVEAGAQKNTITSVNGKTGAVTITKSDLGLGSVENIGIKILTQSQYNALSSTEKNRTDKLYGVY